MSQKIQSTDPIDALAEFVLANYHRLRRQDSFIAKEPPEPSKKEQGSQPKTHQRVKGDASQNQHPADPPRHS